MDTLQKVWEDVLQSECEFQKIGALLIKRKMKERGINLSPTQTSCIEDALANNKLNSFTLDLTPDQEAKIHTKNQDTGFTIDISDSEGDIEKIHQDVENVLIERFPKIIDDVSEIILKSLTRESFSMIKYEAKQRRGFESRLLKKWRKPFRLLEMIQTISLEVGDDFNSEFRSQAATENDFVFDVLTRMHARACQISSEIICLLKGGFADGANARWRTLHEIAVTNSFIKEHGNEVAEKYILHDNIESYKAALIYDQNTKKLSLDPLQKDELTKLEEVKEKLILRFGKCYKENYGWASETLGKCSPIFSDIEKDVGLDYLRPYYKLASHNVHAQPKGIHFKLGLVQGQDILLAGPSNYGFTDPAQLLASSLTQITTILLTYKPNVDRLVTCNILCKLRDETANEFLKVQKRIEIEEANFSNQ
jgi:translation initiation factor 2 beta subunit (eIF-2beta)/eIF-5